MDCVTGIVLLWLETWEDGWEKTWFGWDSMVPWDEARVEDVLVLTLQWERDVLYFTSSFFIDRFSFIYSSFFSQRQVVDQTQSG